MLSKSLRVMILASVATAGLLAPSVVDAPAEARPPTASDPAVITEWNAIADRTIFAENSTPVPSSNLYFGFVSIAVYDAVVAINGEYKSFNRQPRAHRQASTEAAVATAAYTVLRKYFPASAQNLLADYRASLSEVRKGIGLVTGIRAGAAAALSLIKSRHHDGRNAPITLDVAPAPGVWRPTPPALAPMAVPWLGFVRPLTLKSQKQFKLPPPNPLGSAAYAADFTEVKDYGSLEGSARTPLQTETALFFSANPVSQYQAAMRDAVTRRGMDIVESARAFALLGTSTADALITCWRAKYDVPTWRPITAIRLADTDGNAATVADPAWTPMIPTPPYSDYASGHGFLTGAASNVFGYLFGENSIDINVSSPATSTTRHYDSTDVWDQEAMDARVWLGIHFRASMGFANDTGHAVSDWVIAKRFQPRR